MQLGLAPKRFQPWKTLGRARAIENQVAYSAATARAGRRAARSDFCQLADRVLDLPQPSPASQ